MNLAFSNLNDSGVLDKERVVFTAEADCDIGFYAVFRCKTREKGLPLSGVVPGAYWFMNKPVKKGDLVVLYSKMGSRGEKENDAGSKSYFFYWGMEEPLWGTGFIPVLVSTTSWKRFKAE